jgi:hypothetical protein
MLVACRQTEFRTGRFVAVAVFLTLVGLGTVEFLAPERYVPGAAAWAEVELSFSGDEPPSAAEVRERALSDANLAAVSERYAVRCGADAQVSGERGARWRKQLVVEVRTCGHDDRRRIRFLAERGSDEFADAALLEAIAAQYAADALDERRSAEVAASAVAADFVEPREVEPSETVADGVAELLRTRARLLETLQPAHPEVVALDARLDALQTAASNSPIRRMSAEAVAPPGVTSAEIPVVVTRRPVWFPWAERPFWYVAVCIPALAVAGWSARARSQRVAVPREAVVREAAPKRVAAGLRPTVVVRRRRPAEPA